MKVNIKNQHDLCGIYQITNKLNGKKYIGQSKHIQQRFNEHILDSFNPNKKSYNFPIHSAIRKYGLENFTFEVIEECSVELLNEREQYYIQQFNTLNNGYNCTPGGEINPQSDEKIKQKACHNRNENNQKKYGVISTLSLPEVQEKIQSTRKEKYGLSNPNRDITPWTKAKETNLKKYGAPLACCTPENLEKSYWSRVKNGFSFTYRNIETGFVFTSKEASEWLHLSSFRSCISKYFTGQIKSVGKIPVDPRISNNLYGKKAHWEKISYEEYEEIKRWMDSL